MTAVNSDQVNDSSIDGEADIVERAIRYNTQRYLNLLSLSQNDLTGPLGITKGAVSQLLTGNSKLKFRQVYILARTFGVTVEELMDPTYMLESEELSRQLMENRRKTKAEYLIAVYDTFEQLIEQILDRTDAMLLNVHVLNNQICMKIQINLENAWNIPEWNYWYAVGGSVNIRQLEKTWYLEFTIESDLV